LILNARDAMPSGGVLQMRTFAAGGAVCAEVADSGTGIPAEARHRVFDPFYTTKATDRSGPVPSSGTGLGLSVTYGIVQEHGGIIQVTGEPGEGACFRLEFPALAADGAAMGADGAEPRRVHA
ncbi:MAG: sensor histidine kinase, partial [Terriglobales bacterium]